MSLEAAGFAGRGRGAYLARETKSPERQTAAQHDGGLKARGSSGWRDRRYQLSKPITQLRGETGKNQVIDARVAMTQSLGGVAANAVTHIFTN